MPLRRFKTLHKLIAVGALVAVAALLLAVAPSHAHAANAINDACQGVGLTSGGGGCSTGSGKSLSGVLKAIVNILSAIVGVAAVIMIVLGGLRYVTSAGDANNVSAAKKTIIYALVGLVIVAMAQVIVHFVIKSAADSSGVVLLYKHFGL